MVQNQPDGKDFCSESLWDIAKILFHQKIKEENGDLAKVQQFLCDNTTYESVLDSCETVLKKAESKYSTGSVTIGGKEIFPRKRLANILKKVQMFVQFGDIAIQHNPETTSLIWAAFRMMLQVAITDMETCELLTDACEEISGTLFFCAVYEKRYKLTVSIDGNDDVAMRVLEKIPPLYAIILELSYEARRFLGRDTLARFLRSGTRMRFQDLVSDIKGKIQDVHTTAGLAFHERALNTLEELHKGSKEDSEYLYGYIQEIMFNITNKLNETNDGVQKLGSDRKEKLIIKEKQKLKAEYERNLKWLDGLEDIGSEYQLNLKRRQANTCTWIFETQEYKNWCKSDCSKILWISGNAGFGKSVLLSAIIEKLKSEDNSRTVLFFFCKTGDDSTQRSGSILRNLISQLYKRLPDVSPELMEKCTKIITEARDTKQNEVEYAKSTNNLGMIMEEIIEAFEEQIFIVIDAVDECSDRKQEGLLATLRGLAAASLGIKILLASRPESDICHDLKKTQRVELCESNNAGDIKTYVARELSELSTLNENERIAARKAIIKRSAGMFRYANLAIDRLRQPWRRPLKTHLDALPIGLEDFYRQRFGQIRPELQEILIIALRWTVLAERDITALMVAEDYMRVFEVNEDEISCKKGEGEDMDKGSEDEDETDKEDIDKDDMEKDADEEDIDVRGREDKDIKGHIDMLQDTLRHIKEAGSVFLEVIDEGTVLRLRHASVKDFVLGGKEADVPVDYPQAICQRCSAIISQTPQIALNSKLGHLEISLTIFSHLNSEAFLKLYLLDSPIGVSKHDLVSVSSENDAQRYELTHWMYHLREAGSLWAVEERQRSEGWKKLWMLVDRFFENTAAFHSWQYIIWSKTHSPLEWDKDSIDQPIHVAASYGLTALVERLLDRGVDVNTANSRGNTALHWAAENQHYDTVDLLLRRGATIDIRDSLQVTPLWMAAWTHNTEIVELLLKNGADPTAAGSGNVTPIHGACYTGNLSVFRLLVKYGVKDVGVKDSVEETPLHNALYRPNPPPPELIKELIRLGANVNDQNNESQAPLYKAAILGSKKIVSILLNAGADIDDDDIFGTTALHAAVQEGHTEIVRLLVEKLANLNVCNKQGDTPLTLAARGGRTDIVRCLLKKHVDKSAYVNMVNIEGKTALHEAAENGHETIVTMLLKADVSDSALQARDYSLQATPLHLAAREGLKKVVEILIEHGSDINARTRSGETPFDLALESWITEEADYLDYLISLMKDFMADAPSLLHTAVKRGHELATKKLLELGVSPNGVNDHGWTPMLTALHYHRQKILEILKSYGAITMEFSSNDGIGSYSKGGYPPTSWSPNLEIPGCKVLEDGVGLHILLESQRDFGSIQANHIMPAGNYLYYFEVEVLEGPKAAAILGIGICQPGANLRNFFPGWYVPGVNSYGYHGDDGKFFHAGLPSHSYGPTWGFGDIVGCGVDFRSGSLFFTKNGEFLGVACTGVEGEFYPVFGFGVHEQVALVRANFGQDQTRPFSYQPANSPEPAEISNLLAEIEVKE